MASKLLETEFTVVDQMRVSHKWMAEYPELRGFGDGHLLVLAPSCAGELDLANLGGVATTPSGKEAPLAFDKVIVNKAGGVSLFFEGIFTKTVPNGSTVRFKRAFEEKTVNDDAKYVFKERLGVSEAERILPRLEKEGIRFQIDPDLSPHGSIYNFHDNRIALFVHVDDVTTWERIRPDYYPE